MEFPRVPESVDTLPRIGYFQSKDSSSHSLLELSYGMPIYVDKHDNVYVRIDAQWYRHVINSEWAIPKRSFIVYFAGYYFGKDSMLENWCLSLHVFPRDFSLREVKHEHP